MESSSSECLGRFEKIRVLGTGSFGKAWLVRSTKSHSYYVIKEMIVSQSQEFKTKNEVDILQRCFHFNIIRYKEFFYSTDTLDTEGSRIMYMVMEYADGGDLHVYLSRRNNTRSYMEESRIKNWFVQIALALNYLHKEMILHRDLKTRNIFVTNGDRILKLGDFGISRTLSHENDFATTGIGTPQYLSPEMCQSKPYNYKSDIWSLGCVLYEMCALTPAFHGSDFAPLMNKIISASYDPIPPGYTDILHDLLKVLLQPSPKKRPSAGQILSTPLFIEEVKNYMQYVTNVPNMNRTKFEEVGGRKTSCGSTTSV